MSVTLPTKLGGVDSRSVGSPNRGWLPTGLVNYTMPDPSSTSNTDHERECRPHNSRGCRITVQKGDSGDPTITRDLCLPDLLGGEEGWGSEASNKSEGPQPICEGGTFQDGGPSSPSRSPPARRLDGQDRLEGCIPTSPNPPRPPIISELPLGAEMLQIHLPSIRPVISAESIHQTDEASSGLPKAGGMSLNSVSGRPVDSTPRQGPATAGNPINQPALSESGSDHQPEEIYSGSHPENRIFGLRNSLTLNDPIITIRENEKDPTGCSQAVDSDISVSERDSPICWESYSYNTSIAASPSSLQSTTVSQCIQWVTHRRG